MSYYQRLAGTSLGSFLISLTNGVLLKLSAGRLQLRNPADTTFSGLDASNVDVVNATNFKTRIQNQAAQATDWTLSLPTTAGTANQVLQTNGSGVTVWATAATTDDLPHVIEATVAFGSVSPVPVVTLPAGFQVAWTKVIVDTPFTGTANLSVGTSGNSSKYMNATDSALAYPALTVFQAASGHPSVGAPEVIDVDYSAGGASAGSARVQIAYIDPTP